MILEVTIILNFDVITQLKFSIINDKNICQLMSFTFRTCVIYIKHLTSMFIYK